MMENYKITYHTDVYVPTADKDIFITDMIGNAYTVNSKDDTIKLIAKVYFKLIDVERAFASEFNISQLYASNEKLEYVFNNLFDASLFEYNKEVIRFFEGTLHTLSFMFLDSIEILPPYRKQNMSSFIVEDIINRFGNSFQLAVTLALPLQSSVYVDIALNPVWYAKLNLEKLERDEELSFYKIASLLQKHKFVSPLGSNLFVRDIFY